MSLNELTKRVNERKIWEIITGRGVFTFYYLEFDI